MGGLRGKWWVLWHGNLKIPRGDINGVGEDEVTVTSGLHAQAERTKKQRNKRGNSVSERDDVTFCSSYQEVRGVTVSFAAKWVPPNSVYGLP